MANRTLGTGIFFEERDLESERRDFGTVNKELANDLDR
jgi:hypothetical protein